MRFPRIPRILLPLLGLLAVFSGCFQIAHADVLKQSSTARVLVFLMVDAGDHVTGKTGLTPTVTLSKNGASFGAAAGTVAAVGNGWYKLTPSSADTGTTGPLILHAAAAGADPTDLRYDVVAYDPDDATALGLSRIDAAVSTRSTYAGGAVASVTGNVGGNVVGSVGSISGISFPTNFSSLSIAGGGSITIGGYASGQDPLTLLMDGANGVESGTTLRQALRLFMAVLAGKSTESTPAGTLVFKRKDGTTTALTVTHDAKGNRSVITVGSL